MKRHTYPGICLEFKQLTFLLPILIFFSTPAMAQIGRYWDQNLNSEAALLSGTVVAGEGGIAAIYYNPATISQMTKNNLSLSANLFSIYFLNAKNALGTDFPADRTQFDIYPRIITLTVNPKKKPNLTIELAYFVKTNEYLQIDQGTSLSGNIVASNEGEENYTGEYYLRSKFQDYYGGAGFGYKVTRNLAFGFSTLISYKYEQYYNQITANAFTMPGTGEGSQNQYLSQSAFILKNNMYDVRFITKLGIHYKKDSWAFGANINLPSLKLFGDGTVVKEFEYSNIHREAGNPAGFNHYEAARQKDCISHFKDPLSVATGANYYSPSGKTTLLFTAEYFLGLHEFNYIEASYDPGEEGYSYANGDPKEWLSFPVSQNPVLNVGLAFKQRVNSSLMLSGGFRTDFKYLDTPDDIAFPGTNRNINYNVNVYHLNYGFIKDFKRGSITLGMQFSYGQEKNVRQVVNLKDPDEYISDSYMPLTGYINNNVLVRYFDISVYFGFQFNFMQ